MKKAHLSSTLAILSCLAATPAFPQTYYQMSWGITKDVSPYSFGANIGGTWRNLGTVSSGGVWSIPSSNLSFTPSGTGGVATTVSAFLGQYYYITNYDTLQHALSAAGSAAVNVPFGTYTLAIGLALGNQTQINGDFGGNSSWAYSGTTGAAFTLGGDASMVKNVRLTQTGSPTSTTAIDMGTIGGQQKTLRDVRLLGPFTTGITKTTGVVGNLDNVVVSTSGTTGISLSNPTVPDSGDDYWHGVTVSGPTGDLVNYQSAGGLKVNGYKGLGGVNGFHLAIPNSTATQDFLFTGSSIENSSSNCMLLETSGTTGVFGNIVVVGNEFAGCPTGVNLNNSGAANAIIEGNAFSSISSSAITLNPGANNITVGLNSYSTAFPMTDNRVDFVNEGGIVTWRFKRGRINITTTTSNFYRLDLPAFRGASCTAIIEGIVQGAGSFLMHQEFSLISGAAGTALTYANVANMTYAAGQTVDFKTDTATTPGSIYIGIAQHTGVGSSVAGTFEIECRGKLKAVVYQ